MATTTVYDGTAGDISGSTPFGIYDLQTEFQTDGPKVADWCARRIGYPIVDIELQDQNFFACFEEAVTEYSSQVNRFNIKENLLSAKGNSTSTNYTHKNITPNLGTMVGLSKQYGTEAGIGGDVSLYSGSISVSTSSQVYDLNDSSVTTYESGTPGTDDIEVRRVFFQSSPAMTRFFDPHIGSGLGSQQMLTNFGWGSYSPAINYLLMPMYDDLLRVQAIEFNDMIRKSAYSFHIANNKLKIFPIPTDTYTLWFQYIKTSDRNTLVTSDTVSDFSNMKYNNMSYENINEPGKQWIKKYTLALAKELLGYVRGKYQTVPIPGAEVSLNQGDLIAAATAEKAALIEKLRNDLDENSRKLQLQRKAEEAEAMKSTLDQVPLPIYIA